MARPQTQAELEKYVEQMRSVGMSNDEVKIVVDDYIDRQLQAQAEQPQSLGEGAWQGVKNVVTPVAKSAVNAASVIGGGSVLDMPFKEGGVTDVISNAAKQGYESGVELRDRTREYVQNKPEAPMSAEGNIFDVSGSPSMFTPNMQQPIGSAFPDRQPNERSIENIAQQSQQDLSSKAGSGALSLAGEAAPVVSAVTSAVASPVTEAVSPVLEGGINSLSDEAKQTLSNAIEGYDQLDEGTKLLISYIGLLADALPAAGSIKGAKSGAKLIDNVSVPDIPLPEIRSFDQSLKGLKEVFSKPITVESTKQAKDMVSKSVDQLVDSKLLNNLATESEIANILNKSNSQAIKDTFMSVVEHRLNNSNPSTTNLITQKFDQAVQKITKDMNNKGTELGEFRDKLASKEVNPKSIENVKNKLTSLIDDSFGLSLDEENKLVKKITRDVSVTPSEMNILQGWVNSLNSIQQTKNLEKLEDVISNIDKDVKRAVQNLETQNDLQSVASLFRKELEKVRNDIIGAENTSILKDFSNLKKIINDISKNTTKGRNSEALLKKVLSARDRTPKELLATIKKYTGMDLEKDIQIANLAERMLGTAESQSNFYKDLGDIVMSGVAGGPKGAAVVTGAKAAKKAYSWFSAQGKTQREINKIIDQARSISEKIQSLRDLGVNDADLQDILNSNFDLGVKRLKSSKTP